MYQPRFYRHPAHARPGRLGSSASPMWLKASATSDGQLSRATAGNSAAAGLSSAFKRRGISLLSPEDGPEQAAGSQSGGWPDGLPRAGAL
eukprot:scaffold3317_cov80-Phaeocystis_antarctica.AAC.5